MVSLYIFDMGGVVCNNFRDIPLISKELGITEEEFFIYAGENFQILLEGKIDSREFWKRFSQSLGKYIGEDLFKKYFHPQLNLEVIEIIKQLKKFSRVVCGSNTLDTHYDYLANRGAYDIFDRVYVSNKIGLSKPEANFFWYILREEKTIPADTVFIDDLEENILSARKIGINSILFTDPDSLKQQIKNIIK
ncbi:MAG: glucose-1-phosphatase [Candidatus Caldatribacteriota bacterium]